MNRHIQKISPPVDVFKRPWFSQCIHPGFARRRWWYVSQAANSFMKNPVVRIFSKAEQTITATLASGLTTLRICSRSLAAQLFSTAPLLRILGGSEIWSCRSWISRFCDHLSLLLYFRGLAQLRGENGSAASIVRNGVGA